MKPVDQQHQYTGIQALRFFAALLVVATHASAMIAERLMHGSVKDFWRTGLAGVDIFFVISGFVMTMSAQRLLDRPNGWTIFLERRMIRVVPMYWIATTLKLLLVLAMPALALHTQLTAERVLSSYLFFPSRNADGDILPILSVGWTLSFEMLFYLVFAAAMFIRFSPVLISLVLFSILTLCGLLFKTVYSPAVWMFLDGLTLEFVMGMLIAQLCLKKISVPAPIGLLGIVLAAALMHFFTPQDAALSMPVLAWRFVYWGLPAMLLVGSIALLEPAIAGRMPKLLLLLGDASYSLYLFHTMLIPAIGVIFIKLGWLNPQFLLMVCLIVNPIVSLLFYHYLELPLTEWLKRLRGSKKIKNEATAA
ncbi:acyltransferase family protein [Ampullimonas aquatilis]|uniref:acyltransferase family protein n=1 Tax=Ampullimonas aquatilis TaxID=1341549 RepID=UPI003C78ECBF